MQGPRCPGGCRAVTLLQGATLLYCEHVGAWQIASSVTCSAPCGPCGIQVERAVPTRLLFLSILFFLSSSALMCRRWASPQDANKAICHTPVFPFIEFTEIEVPYVARFPGANTECFFGLPYPQHSHAALSSCW